MQRNNDKVTQFDQVAPLQEIEYSWVWLLIKGGGV